VKVCVTRSDVLRALADRLAELGGREAADGVRHVAELLEQHPLEQVEDVVGLVVTHCEAMAIRLRAGAEIWTTAGRVLGSLADPPAPAPANVAPAPLSPLEQLQHERDVYARALLAARADMYRLHVEATVYARMVARVEREIEQLGERRS
jgi:hypothetical protein